MRPASFFVFFLVVYQICVSRNLIVSDMLCPRKNKVWYSFIYVP